MFLLSSIILFTQKIVDGDISKPSCRDFQHLNCIEYSNKKEDFYNLSYINQHKIPSDTFIYKSTGENDQYPLSNAFDIRNTKTFWAASIPNNASFHNSITVEFKKTVSIEAILYYPSYYTKSNKNKEKIRIFNGSPTKLKLYTSINRQNFQFNTIFVGNPDNNNDHLQFKLPNPILCDQIKIEFVEVTPDTQTTNGSLIPISCGIIFLQTLNSIQKVNRKKIITDISGECGPGVIYSLVSDTLTISGNGMINNYTNDDPTPWHSNKTLITTIVIEEGVTLIGERAFFSHKSLLTVTLPSSVTTICKEAFYYSDKLETINFPEGLNYIGIYSFCLCSSLTSLTFPSSLTEIDEFAFSTCRYLSSLTFLNSPAKIGFKAFVGDSSIVSINFGNEIISLGERSFDQCTKLESITIPDSVIEIGTEAFFTCKLLAYVTIGKGLSKIGETPFKFCTSLISYTVDPDNNYFKSKDDVFYSKDETILYEYPACKPDISYIISDLVINISAFSFRETVYLVYLTIGNNVKYIGKYAFHYCKNLTSLIIPDSVVEIGEYAFYLDDNITSIKLSENLVSIEKHVLASTNITSLYIPDSVISVGIEAVTFCYELISIEFGNGLISIDESAFIYCTNLESLTIPDNVKTIGECAFQNCQSVVTAKIGKGVTSIGLNAFKNTYSLVLFDVDLNNNYYKSKDDILYTKNDSVLVKYPASKAVFSFRIPNEVTYIEQYAFHRSLNLNYVYIPDSVTLIGAFAFANCINITTVRLSNSITTIELSTFDTCKSLAYIEIPESVTFVEKDSFHTCLSLYDITYVGENPPNYNNYVFFENPKLSYVTVRPHYKGTTFCGKKVQIFTASFSCTETLQFTASGSFSPSSKFSPSFSFSPSLSFTSSKSFTPSISFSQSFLFSSSLKFSLSSSFSPSLNENDLVILTPTNVFSLSNSFSFQNLITKTNTFTPSNIFTPSSFFTPKRTKFPDPRNIFNKVQIDGRRNSSLFSKEEFKKAAVPIVFFVVLSSVSSVMFVFYLKNRIKQIKNPEEVPDFDSSFIDHELDDSSTSSSNYSYTCSYSSSYYTYNSYSYSDD